MSGIRISLPVFSQPDHRQFIEADLVEIEMENGETFRLSDLIRIILKMNIR